MNQKIKELGKKYWPVMVIAFTPGPIVFSSTSLYCAKENTYCNKLISEYKEYFISDFGRENEERSNLELIAQKEEDNKEKLFQNN